MENALRNWKCRNCGRANRTEVALEGTAKCEYCTYTMSVQPSRVKNGVTLPSTFPARRGTAGADAAGRPLGEAN